MEDLNENFVSKTQYEELERKHQLQSEELKIKHQMKYEEFKRMLNTVLNAEKREPTKEIEEEHVKHPLLETRALHIQEEESDVTKAEQAPSEQQDKELKEDQREQQVKPPTLETNIVSPWVPAGAGLTNGNSVMCLPNHLDVGSYVQDLKQGRKRSPAGTLSGSNPGRAN